MLDSIGSLSSNKGPESGDSFQEMFNLIRREKAGIRFSKNCDTLEAAKTASEIANNVIQDQNN
jgi:hypothetical protein